MPTIFIDNDGIIIEYRWSFEGGVNLSQSGISLTSDFSSTNSILPNPQVSWLEPGLKNITLEVIDDDGNASVSYFQVEVNNQRPVPVFNRPSDGKTDTAYVFQSLSFDTDGDSSELSHIWNISDMDESIYNISSISRTPMEKSLKCVGHSQR